MKADYKKIRRKLNIAIGQLNAVSNMVDNDKYCVDISMQLLAVISALKGINKDILNAHLKSCVVNAIKDGKQDEIDIKIDEVMNVLTKMLK